MPSIWVLLILLPLAALSGWWARGKADRRGNQDAASNAPNVHADYLRGISELVNDDADQAIATFSRLLEVDNDTVETHLALGNLFRRQGDIDRALRLHQNLVARPNLALEYRNQARFELAQDYLRAGVLDRAEDLLHELVDQELFLIRSLNGLITIHEKVRDWQAAIDATRRLEKARGNSLRPILAQYYCELAEQASQEGDPSLAQVNLKSAHQAFADCARISLISGFLAEEAGDSRLAIRAYRRVVQQDVGFVHEILEPVRRCFDHLGDEAGYAEFLFDVMAVYDGAQPHVAYARLLSRQARADEGIAHLSRYLQEEPSWIGFYHMLDLAASAQQSGLTGPLDSLRLSLAEIMQREPLYLCGHCGFSGRYLHWQCPSCRQWNTIAPVRDIRPGTQLGVRRAC